MTYILSEPNEEGRSRLDYELDNGGKGYFFMSEDIADIFNHSSHDAKVLYIDSVVRSLHGETDGC
jgi:hypothetical protein